MLLNLGVMALALLTGANAYNRGQEKRQTPINPAALNPQLSPLLPLNGGPQLGYNGSGLVPP